LKSTATFSCSSNTASANAVGGIRLSGMDGLAGSVTLSPCTGGIPYVVEGSLLVPGGSTLSFSPGSVVKFNGGDSGIRVLGSLQAVGTSAPGGRITFTSIQDPISPEPGQWDAIHIDSPDSGVINIAYADIRYGGNNCCSQPNALVTNASSTGSLTITQSTLNSSLSYAVSNNLSAPLADARYNWWGSSTGPSEGGSPPCSPTPRPAGSGLAVSCNVLFSNWLLDPSADVDRDTVPDVSDNCPATANPDQLDTDGEGLGDACDPCPLNPDCDADTWTDGAEAFISTDPLVACLSNGWPPDVNSNGGVGIDDVFFAASRFGQSSGGPSYSARAEIASQDGAIGIDDVFGFTSHFYESCT